MDDRQEDLLVPEQPETSAAEPVLQFEEKGATAYSEHVSKLVDQFLDIGKQIAELVRYIAFGLIAFFFACANATSGLGYRIARDSESILVLCALCGCLTILFDYLNLACRRKTHSDLLDLIDSNSDKLLKSADGKHYQFNPNDGSYIWSGRFYRWKQYTTIGGCVLLVTAFVKLLFS